MGRIGLVVGVLCTFVWALKTDVRDPLEAFISQGPSPCPTSIHPKQPQKSTKNAKHSPSLDCLDLGGYVGKEAPKSPKTPSIKANKSSTKPKNSSSTKAKVSSTVPKSIKNVSLPQTQKHFSWVKSVGLIMVSFDDGSFKNGFGVLLPDKMFLTSAELAHNSAAYPKHILLKMRDETSGNLICVAQLYLSLVDKMKGLALFKIAGYTDDYCNIRSQSYYHQHILNNNAFELTKVRPYDTTKFYTIATNFNDMDIDILRIDDKKTLPVNETQRIIFGRPFFSKNGHFLGISTMTNSAITPIIVNQKEIRKFICSMPQAGLQPPLSIRQFCNASL